jgi:hypothetical protein
MSDDGINPAKRLEYATETTDARLLFTQDGECATVVIRRPERRREAVERFMSTVPGEAFLYFVIAVAVLAWLKPAALPLLIGGSVALVAGMYATVWLAYARLARPIVVELTPTELVASNLDAQARPLTLPRDGMYAIYYVGHAKCIFVRRRGKEMVGLYLTPNPEDAEQVAAFLSEAAGTNVAGNDALATPPPP